MKNLAEWERIELDSLRILVKSQAQLINTYEKILSNVHFSKKKLEISIPKLNELIINNERLMNDSH